MAAKSKKKSIRKKVSGGQRLSPAEKAAFGQIKQGVKHVEKSIGEVQKGLRRAEKAIEADAKARVRALRKEANVQLAALKAKRREAVGLVKRLRVAAGDSWQDVRQSAEQVIADAKATAGGIADRIRTALRG